MPGPNDTFKKALRESNDLRHAERQELIARAELEVRRARQEERRRVMHEAEALHNKRMEDVLKAASYEQAKQQETIVESWQVQQAQVISWQEAAVSYTHLTLPTR